MHLRQAPSLGSGEGVKAGILQWCHRRAGEEGSVAWRMLGYAILQIKVGASLVVYMGAWLDLNVASRVADWLRWHRRQKKFGYADLEVCKKRSAVRALWNSVRRGSGVDRHLTEKRKGLATELLSDKAAGHLCSLRLEGFIRCGVGRTPLHLRGELPVATMTGGKIQECTWVTAEKATMSEGQLAAALLVDNVRESGRRRVTEVPGLQRLAAALKLCGGTKIISMAKLVALLRSRQGKKGGERVDLRGLTANTLMANKIATLLLLRADVKGRVVAEALTAQDWATLMGVELWPEHPLRRGLRAVSESAAKAIVGQAVHVDVAYRILSAVCAHTDRLATRRQVNYASLLSGMDFMAAAMERLFGERFRFVLAAEANATVARALVAAWGPRLLQVTHNALSAETERALRLMEDRLDVLMISFRCAPWSKANTIAIHELRRLEQLERALEENQALLGMVRLARPLIVLIECVDGLEQRQLRRHWDRLQGMITSLQEWSWTRQTICPRDTLGGHVPRRRVWIVGIRREQLPQPEVAGAGRGTKYVGGKSRNREVYDRERQGKKRAVDGGGRKGTPRAEHGSANGGV